MSAWHIGALTGLRRETVRTQTGEVRSAAPEVPTVDTLATWIPGDAIAFYAAIVLALQPDPPAELKVTSLGWLVVGVAAAMVLTWLGGWARTDKLDKSKYVELVARTILAGVAFAIWSLVVPGSWWYSIESLSDNKVVVPIVAGLGGAAFSLFAEGLVRRLPRWFPPRPKKRQVLPLGSGSGAGVSPPGTFHGDDPDSP